ncbi:MAG: hypothetical protein U0325_01060 [Polyangiales bacterium]
MSRRAPVYALALLAQGASLAALDGRLHHDEVHQYAEPAHRMVWGFGTVTHEWHRGMRNTLAPGALAGLFRAALAAGFDGPWALFLVRHGAMALLSLLTLRAVMDHVRHRTSRDDLARSAGLTLALALPWAALAARPLGESLSVAAVMLAVRARDRGASVTTGALAGLAFVLRYPAGLFAAAVGLASPRALPRFALGLALPLGVLAALDHLAWGAPFASVRAYAAYNLVQDRARLDYGARPWWFYLACFAAFGPWPLAVGLRGPGSLRRALPTLAPAGVYLLAMSAVAHKEPRFFLTALPLLVAAAACAAGQTSRHTRAALALVGVQGLAITAAWWHLGIVQGDIARATRAASARPDLAALWVMNASHPGWVNLRRALPLHADPQERLAATLAALDRAPAPTAGRAYAICDGRLRAGEGPRCVDALRRRGFSAVSSHGRAWLLVR